jgi:hypothetical protein
VAESAQWCLVEVSETPGPRSREVRLPTTLRFAHGSIFGLYEALEASRPFEWLRDETAEMLQPPGEALSVKISPPGAVDAYGGSWRAAAGKLDTRNQCLARRVGD